MQVQRGRCFQGQVSVFLIMGILLVIITGIFLFFLSQQKPSPETTPLQTDAVVQMIEGCMQKTTQEGIMHTGKRGGYFILPLEATTELLENLPYYKIGMQELIPSPERRMEEITRYVDTMLNSCLDFSTFEKQGYNVTRGIPHTTAVLSEDKQFLNIKTALPITLKKGLQTKELGVFSIRILVNQMEEDFAVAQEIVATQDGSAICLTCFSPLAEEYGLVIEVLPYDDNIYVYELKDEDYILKNENYLLRFAVKYDSEEEAE